MSSCTDIPTVKLVARQPIFDRRERLTGYELLFRSDPTQNAHNHDRAAASLELIADSLMLHGLTELADDRRVFVNLTRADLLAGHAKYLPRKTTVIEILESVPAESDVLAALRKLRQAGYTLALDDVTSAERLEAFAGLVEIAKVDLTLTTRTRQHQLQKIIRKLRMKSVAEKVETRAEFVDLAAAGFDYFQGYFFARPEMLGRRDAAPTAGNSLRILQMLHRADFDLTEAEAVVGQEPVFAYKLLRYLNSSLFRFDNSVESIRHALLLLGKDEVRRWASIAALCALTRGASPELALTALRRAAFCENLATLSGLSLAPEKLFLAGLLSMLDGILGRSRGEIVNDLGLDRDIAAALLGHDGGPSAVLRLAEAYDRADWAVVEAQAAHLGLNDTQILIAFSGAVDRSRKILGETANVKPAAENRPGRPADPPQVAQPGRGGDQRPAPSPFRNWSVPTATRLGRRAQRPAH